MHRWLFLLGLFPLTLAGCYHDDEIHRSGMGGRCDTGVAFQLSSLQDLLDKHEPTTLRVCFDRSCDELTLRGRRGQYWCEGAPGGPPDQLTWCDFSRNGAVTVAILRVDGQDYSNNAPHTAAISIRDGKDQRLFTHAEVVRFSESSCGFRKIRLSAPAPERADSTPPPPPPASDERPADEPPPADEAPADPPTEDPPEDPEADPSDPADPPPSDG